MYSLRWIGGNEQPDIFTYVYSTANFSPAGANRGHYSNPRLDALLADAAADTDMARRREDYVAAQQNPGTGSSGHQSVVSRHDHRA